MVSGHSRSMHGRHQTGLVSTMWALPSGRVTRSSVGPNNRGHAEGRAPRAKCMAPESFDTSARQWTRTPASVGRSVSDQVDGRSPLAQSGLQLAADRSVGGLADEHDGRRRRRQRALASAANDFAGQRFAPPYAAPGASATSGDRPSHPARASSVAPARGFRL